MTGRTHVAAGVAAALAVAGPGAGPVTLALAAAGGAVGAVLPDLDVRDTAHPLRDRAARLAAAALLLAALALDAARGGSLLRVTGERGAGAAVLGLVALAALACAARLSPHRGFSHSLAALAGFTAATWLAFAPLAPFVAAGLASHLALDPLNSRGLRLLWPLRATFCLGVARTGGVVDACLLAASALAVAGTLLAAAGA